MHAQNKDRPSPEWIAAIRRRYQVEREIDRALTYKLEQRSTPPYSKLPLETLVKGAQSLIGANLEQPFEITDAKWLAGGASKLQLAFNLTWNRPGVGNETTRMVLRNDLAEALHATSRLREFQIVSALHQVIPVPPVFWVDNTAEHLSAYGSNSFGQNGYNFNTWRGLSALNEHHMLFAWVSLFSVGLTDFYVRLVSSGAIRDLRLL